MPTMPTKSDTLIEDQVAAYLDQHPDFFQKRDDLIARLELPDDKGKAVSLIERQVSVLRDRNMNSRRQIDQLIESAGKNTEIFNRCRKLVLALIEAQDTSQFFKALEIGFDSEFNCSAYSLLVFGDQSSQFNHFTYSLPLDAVKPTVGNILASKKPVLGVLRQEQQDFLFRHASDKVRSAAVLTIVSNNEPIGLLSIGSDSPTYFEPELGTLFLGFIADTLARLIPRFINQAFINQGFKNQEFIN